MASKTTINFFDESWDRTARMGFEADRVRPATPPKARSGIGSTVRSWVNLPARRGQQPDEDAPAHPHQVTTSNPDQS